VDKGQNVKLYVADLIRTRIECFENSWELVHDTEYAASVMAVSFAERPTFTKGRSLDVVDLVHYHPIGFAILTQEQNYSIHHRSGRLS
jgi:hypothetical protein